MTPIIKPPPIRFHGMGIIARSIHGRSISPNAYSVNIEYHYKKMHLFTIDLSAENLSKKFHIRNAPITRMVFELTIDGYWLVS